ncbi:aldose epimerase family protein [Massilia glaciei]|uniref:Aldose 1-epimerase n=1 Tax=Massilia glaciei TaxID=1524097 RepID=A0A2U2I684_9BURK|nr:aldose epimerase family protein [Massilia glaciei]PWF55264.1 galactose mutarotase [Massilia glaciei]
MTAQKSEHAAPYALLLLALGCAAPSAFASITVQRFGVTGSGQVVEQVTLVNERGMALSYIDYGATITAIRVPDRKGRAANVMLGLPTLAAYESTKRRHGAVIGRYAGRIGKATYTLDGRIVKLPPNAKGLAIHGDPAGYDRRVWRRHDFADLASIGSVFQLVSPDGDQGFPGRLALRVTYRLLRKQNELRIEYEASTNAPTVINLTNHGFFNLSGAGTRALASHRFRIHASRYVVTDALRVPTGGLASVAGTALDFRRGAGVMERLAQASPVLGAPAWFDHGLVFDKGEGELAQVATIDDAASGRRMRISTSEPSVIFNSGNGYDGTEAGAEGVAYQRHDGFAFETQHLADSPNHAHFPSTALRPGTPYRSVTTFRFSVF